MTNGSCFSCCSFVLKYHIHGFASWIHHCCSFMMQRNWQLVLNNNLNILIPEWVLPLMYVHRFWMRVWRQASLSAHCFTCPFAFYGGTSFFSNSCPTSSLFIDDMVYLCFPSLEITSLFVYIQVGNFIVWPFLTNALYQFRIDANPVSWLIGIAMKSFGIRNHVSEVWCMF